MSNSEIDITKKQMLFRGSLFFAMLFLVLSITFRILWLWDDGYSREVLGNFYRLPKHSVDAICFGSSGMREYYIAVEGFHKSGAAVYNLGTSNQPLAAVKYLIREACKTQSPRLFVIDLRGVTQERIFDGDIRKVSDSMRFSKNRKDLIDALLEERIEFFPDEKINPWESYFSFTTYHQRWENLTREDFGETEVFLGYSLYTRVKELEEEKMIQSEQKEPLPDPIANTLAELLEELKGMEQEVLFIVTPAWYDAIGYGKLLTAADIIRDAGYEVVFFSPEDEEIELDANGDFREYDHVNTFGAIKFTDYFAGYLIEKYALPDHRGEAAYRFWEEEYESFHKALTEYYAAEAQSESEDQP